MCVCVCVCVWLEGKEAKNCLKQFDELKSAQMIDTRSKRKKIKTSPNNSVMLIAKVFVYQEGYDHQMKVGIIN